MLKIYATIVNDRQTTRWPSCGIATSHRIVKLLRHLFRASPIFRAFIFASCFLKTQNGFYSLWIFRIPKRVYLRDGGLLEIPPFSSGSPSA